jgi:hypothetical protein
MLKPEDAEKVLVKNLANVIRKANTGKPLTAAERALIEQAAAGGTLQDTGSAFAKTYDELAQRFAVTRKTLQNASNRFPDDAPKPRADGRHDVAAWSQFLVKHNIARTAENIASAPSDDELTRPVSVTDWKAEELKLKCTKLQLENAKVAGALVDAAEIESGVSVLVQAFRQALNNLPPRLAGKIIGITDYHEAEEIILEEINVVLRTLQRCDFLPAKEAPTEAPDQEQVRSVLSVEVVSSNATIAKQKSTGKAHQPKRPSCERKSSKSKSQTKAVKAATGRSKGKPK